jgi:hypothetical protein
VLAGCTADLEPADDGGPPSTEPTALASPPCLPEDLDCEVPVPDPGAVTCFGIPAPPSGSATYRCAFDVTDAYGAPLAAQPVSMEVRWCSSTGTVVRKTVSGTTGSNGLRTLTAQSAPGNQIHCKLGLSEPTVGGAAKTTKLVQTTAIPTNTTVASDHVLVPLPTLTRTPDGLVAGEAQMDLYLSGAYDKVLVIPEPFDPDEHNIHRRERRRFWSSMGPMLAFLHATGWDVWTFQPHDTGENLHEQAAELAQGIDLAAQHSQCYGTVSVFGFNTAGVVGRIATARWEADAAWRAALDLPTTLPVRLIGTGDAPNYGMHLNLDMQKALWSAGTDLQSETNLDSCAMVQLLRGRWDPDLEVKTNADFLDFWVYGAATDGGACAAGPAVATLNAANGTPGWPSTPVRIGFASSNSTDVTKCHINEDWDVNSRGEYLCPYASDLFPNVATQDWVPTAGQSLVKIDIEWASDQHWNAEDTVAWSDLVPGSRSPILVDGGGTEYVDFQGWGLIFLTADYQLQQRAPSTMIPYKSARGTQGPVGSNPYANVSSPFSSVNWTFDDHAGVADVVDAPAVSFVTGRLATYPPSCPGPQSAPP